MEWLAPGAAKSLSLASHQAAPHRVALDGTNVYWTNGGVGDAPGSVMQLAKRRACSGAACACPPGETMCSTGCADTSTDLNNCGACGTVCDGGPAGPGLCAAGHCIVTLARGPVSGVAIGGSTVYWTGDAVFAMPVAGGTIATINADNAATVIAADSAGAVWISPVPSLEGSTGVTILAPDQTGDTLAIDPTYAYWGNPLTGEIDRIPRIGGAQSPVVSGSGAGGIAVDATSMYWNGQYCALPSSCAGGIFSAPIGGGATMTLASRSGDRGLGSVAVDSTSVYWFDQDALVKAPLSGGSPVTLVTELVQPTCFAIDQSYAYVGVQGSIVRVPLSGGSAELVAPAILGPTAIAVDATSVYWGDDVAYDPMRATPGVPSFTTLRKANK